MPPDPVEVIQDTRDSGQIFIHSIVDDAGLSPAEFRVYAHLARRAGASGAYPGVDSVSRICQLAKMTVIKSIKRLEELKMIRVTRSNGERNRYLLTRSSEWTVTSNGQVASPKERTGSPNEVTPPVQSRERKVIHEGNPLGESFALESTDVKKGKKFTPPDTKLVETYFMELGMNGVSAEQAQKFCDHHGQGGWILKTGRKMIDWRCAARIWRGNWEKWNPSQPTPKSASVQDESAFRDFCDTHPNPKFKTLKSLPVAGNDPMSIGPQFRRWQKNGKHE